MLTVTRLSLLMPVMLALGLLLSGCGGAAPLYSELNEQQANEVQAALIGADIPASKRRVDAGVWAIDIPGETMPRAMEVLTARGLPREGTRSMGELFQKEGFVSSPLEQRARFLYALTQEFERTLGGIEGVVDARVHIALPEDEPLRQEQPSGSASVVIVHRPEVDIAQRETDIRAVITDGVESLDDPNRVTVKFFERSPAAAPEMAEPVQAGISRRTALTLLVLVLGLGLVVGAVLWYQRERWKQAGLPAASTRAGHSGNDARAG